MSKVTNIAELAKRLDSLKKECPDFNYGIEMPQKQTVYYVNFAKLVSKLIPSASNKSAYFDSNSIDKVNKRLEAIERAIRLNDLRRLDMILTELVHDFEIVDTAKCECGCQGMPLLLPDDDPGCEGVTLSFLWFTTLICFTKISCFVTHLGISAVDDAIYTGHCDNQGGPDCKCVAARYRLSTVLIMLTVILMFVSGPFGAAARELIKQAIARCAPAVATA